MVLNPSTMRPVPLERQPVLTDPRRDRSLASTGLVSLRNRSVWAVGLLTLCAGYTAVVAIAILAALDGRPALLEEVGALEGVWPGLAVTTAIAFWSWSFRAHANLRLMDRTGIRHADGAAVGWWFVPFAHLVMPYRVMYETTRGSTAQLHDTGWRKQAVHPTAIWWTILFIGGQLTAYAAQRQLSSATSWTAGRNGVTILAISQAILAAAAIAAICMIAVVNRGQRALGESDMARPSSEAWPWREANPAIEDFLSGTPADAPTIDPRPATQEPAADPFASLAADRATIEQALAAADDTVLAAPKPRSNVAPRSSAPILDIDWIAPCSTCLHVTQPHDSFCSHCGSRL